uniref:MIR domain-containing protein n=1 Tax=Caenorhabditis japonica TaxID=281687 RepID=A0A8R1HXA6_CAEJA
MPKLPFLFAFLLLAVAQFAQADDEFVTCYSVVKFMNANDGSRLHSHDVKYGSGSGQQSVTAVKNSDDINSHWQIFPALNSNCNRGDVIKCGDKIRLKHLTTATFLHSHHFTAPLSKNNQEVSAFGSEAESDSGDNWTVLCHGDEWVESEQFKLRHVVTGAYLSLSGQQYGRPIHGQREVVGTDSITGGSAWKVAEGIHIKHQQKDL